jgi:hypothetical protein
MEDIVIDINPMSISHYVRRQTKMRVDTFILYNDIFVLFDTEISLFDDKISSNSDVFVPNHC